MPKVNGHVTNADSVFTNTSMLETKRGRQWLLDAPETELLTRKKQAWDRPVGFPSVPSLTNEIIAQHFRPEATDPVGLTDRNMSIARKAVGNEPIQNSTSVGPSISYCIEDTDTGLGYGGLKKVKVNLVNDLDRRLTKSDDHGIGISMQSTFTGANFVSMEHPSSKESGNSNTLLINHAYDIGGEDISSITRKLNKNLGDNIFTHSFNKGGNNHSVSFNGYQDDSVLEALERPVCSYSLLFEQSSSAQTAESPVIKEVGIPCHGANVCTSELSNPKPDCIGKKKLETRPTKKEAPNSFPSNVRSLIATGILDGIPVRYVSVSREELPGVIKGCGYLCGCPACNFSKALNAYEFERHAGSKTKHPNNHIYFENGKTIYQIVQELRSTPQSQLFDTIQMVTGSPINQKAFRTWKESFKAATREIQRIYGKEELNL